MGYFESGTIKELLRFYMGNVFKISLVIALFASVAFANEVRIGSGQGAPGSGDNIISVSLQNDVPVRGIQLQIADTLNYLTADSVWALDRVASFDFAYNPSDQNGYLSILLFSTNAAPAASGEILKIRFKVSELAPPRSAVRILCKKAVLTDENNKKLDVSIVDGTFKISGVSAVEQTGQLPQEFRLEQNYPNPFNPSTQIPFSLAQAGLTTLTVYNVIGQKIRSLVSDNLKPGRYEFRWDGMDDYGQPVSAGVYVYQLVSGDYKATRQLTLVR